MENRGIITGQDIIRIAWGVTKYVYLNIPSKEPDLREWGYYARVKREDVLKALQRVPIWEEYKPRVHTYLTPEWGEK